MKKVDSASPKVKVEAKKNTNKNLIAISMS
jgi:hypothetical protein